MHTKISIPQDNPADEQQNNAGKWGLICSIAGIIMCGCWLFSIPGLILSIIGLKREPKTNAQLGLILSIIGIIEMLIAGPLMLAVMLPAFTHGYSTAKVLKTQHIVQMHQAALELHHANDSHPRDFEELVKSGDVHKNHALDPWGQPYHIVQTDSKPSYVVSSGPDKELGTEDDISPKSE